MEILLALLISTAIVREDVHLDIANLSDIEMTKSVSGDESKPTE